MFNGHCRSVVTVRMVISRLTELFSFEANGSTSSPSSMSSKRAEPKESENNASCQICRFVGGGGLTALGLYVLAMANGILPQSNAFGVKRSRRLFTQEAGPRNTAANVLGCVVMTIGLLRTLDIQLPASKKD